MSSYYLFWSEKALSYLTNIFTQTGLHMNQMIHITHSAISEAVGFYGSKSKEWLCYKSDRLQILFLINLLYYSIVIFDHIQIQILDKNKMY